MLIQWILGAKEPFTVTLDRDTYRFEPNKVGHYVCDVAPEEHIDRLLAISEGYEVYGVEASRAREALYAKRKAAEAQAIAREAKAAADAAEKAAKQASEDARAREEAEAKRAAEKLIEDEKRARAAAEAKAKLEKERADARSSGAKG